MEEVYAIYASNNYEVILFFVIALLIPCLITVRLAYKSLFLSNININDYTYNRIMKIGINTSKIKRNFYLNAIVVLIKLMILSILIDLARAGEYKFLIGGIILIGIQMIIHKFIYTFIDNYCYMIYTFYDCNDNIIKNKVLLPTVSYDEKKDYILSTSYNIATIITIIIPMIIYTIYLWIIQ